MNICDVHLLVGLMGAAIAYPEFQRIRVFHNRMFADEDVMVDEAEGYVMVTVSHINGTGIPTINLHDARAGFSVLKDVMHGKCHIHKSSHTMSDMKNRIDRIGHNGGNERISQIFKVVSNSPIPSQNLSFYGDKIASFCKNYESYFMVRSQVVTKRDMMYLASDLAAEARWCFICITITKELAKQESLNMLPDGLSKEPIGGQLCVDCLGKR
ncbi:uncharacterized protein LOC132722018 [Ruditapes philippinarum]|uniref:uncharacterized protein LOC132722018 n=1 Tax=Ruditapes philippinarum TaxID=129788 RepID=UPI00295ADD23|nr:uncharacterized protein LOC132722018 [Ruditapes philippinarum]